MLDAEDSHIWLFSAIGKYSVKSAYEALFIGETSLERVKEFGRAGCSANANFYVDNCLQEMLDI